MADWLEGRFKRPAHKPKGQTPKGARTQFIKAHTDHAKEQLRGEHNYQMKAAKAVYDFFKSPEGLKRIEDEFGSEEEFDLDKDIYRVIRSGAKT